MLNYLWAGMILVGIFYGFLTGNIENVSNAILESAKEAINLCVTMLGVMGVWVGLMKIAENAGMIRYLTRVLMPFAKFMFPRIEKNSKAMEYMCTNMAANLFGLGWAATPAGLKAMEELSKLRQDLEGSEETSKIASNEMCIFLIINISSLQLIPVNIIAYRSQYNSVNPSGIIMPALMATFVSTLVAVIFCKIMDRKGIV